MQKCPRVRIKKKKERRQHLVRAPALSPGVPAGMEAAGQSREEVSAQTPSSCPNRVRRKGSLSGTAGLAGQEGQVARGSRDVSSPQEPCFPLRNMISKSPPLCMYPAGWKLLAMLALVLVIMVWYSISREDSFYFPIAEKEEPCLQGEAERKVSKLFGKRPASPRSSHHQLLHSREHPEPQVLPLRGGGQRAPAPQQLAGRRHQQVRHGHQVENNPDTLLVLVAFKAMDFHWIETILSDKKRVRKGFWKQPPLIWDVNPKQIRILNPFFMEIAADKLLSLPMQQPRKMKQKPTTGLVAITLALHLCDVVHIAGFGYPDAHNRKQTIHYYEQITLKSMAGSGHNVSQEALAIKRMLGMGAVRNLTYF
ncbi:CMP-N-acetylneuraminate-beta-galactosamide-alpha-2,3-sialyltransferase 4 isoform 15-T15 [Molossus nigricans]